MSSIQKSVLLTAAYVATLFVMFFYRIPKMLSAKSDAMFLGGLAFVIVLVIAGYELGRYLWSVLSTHNKE